MSQRLVPERVRLGGMTRRRRPGVGGRPTVRFVIASGFTIAYVAFGVYVSVEFPRSDGQGWAFGHFYLISWSGDASREAARLDPRSMRVLFS
jgi:hypothetical protein